MNKEIPFSQRINARVLAILILVVALTALVLGLMNQENIRRIHQENFTEKVLLSNALIADIVDSEEVKYYVELMKSQDDEFKQRQLQFFYDREELFLLQAEGVSEERQQVLLDRLAVFYEEMSVFKTERYWETASELTRLRDLNHSTYVYILADTGLTTKEGEPLYTFIFDADDSGVYISPDMDGLGTTFAWSEELAEVMSSGRQMEQAAYYLGEYGELFYAYAPIFDEYGKVVAVLGTDVDLGTMNRDIARSMLYSNLVLFASAVVLVLLIFLFLSRNVIQPLRLLTNTAYELSEGKVYSPTPERVLKQSSEIGQLAHAIEEMRLAYQDMIKNTNTLYDAAIIGRLDFRNDEAEFKGDIQTVIKQINATLDATMLYLNSMPESILIMGKDLEVFFENEHFKKSFEGVSAVDFLIQMIPQSEVYENDTSSQRECLQNHIATIIGQEQSSTTAWIDNRCFSVTFKEIDLDETAENSILVIVIDISDLMRETENAQAAAEAKTSFLSRMSHEMRTPMNAIIGMTKIADETDDVERLKYCLDTIQTSSMQLLRIINDVLDMSKIEAGKLELENVPMSIRAMLKKVTSLIASAAEKKQQELIIVVDEDIEMGYLADELRLSQVLTNLLSNAQKFTPEKGKITLSVEIIKKQQEADTVRFSVADTGIGMSKEQTVHLFDAFEQADVSITRKFGGTGLGLAISESIVEKMGGSIHVDSRLGAGSTFSFDITLETLPFPHDDHLPGLRTQTAEADPDGIVEAQDLSKVTILLAEDVDINREIFLVLFEDAQMTVDIAENGEIAVRMFKEDPDRYDLIFMDIQMPEMDGYEATRTIRALDTSKAQNIPIIAMTANAFKEDVERCLESGMNDHVAKPIDKDTVLEMIVKYTNR